MTAHALIVGYLITVRLAELELARRNTKRLLARGGYEVGASHYSFLVAMHVGWLASIALLVPTSPPLHFPALVAFVLLQVARAWVLLSLRGRWTTRIIVVPNEPLVARGPYRWMRHPNYAVVIGEIAVVPLMFGAWEIALAFSVVNAALLTVRIRTENAALGLRT